MIDTASRCGCGHMYLNHRNESYHPCLFCGCTAFGTGLTGGVIQAPHVCTWIPEAEGGLRSCCGTHMWLEPLQRRQIWLPGLQTHLWIATIVMWIDTYLHPWHWDELGAASVLLVLAMVFSAKRKLET